MENGDLSILATLKIWLFLIFLIQEKKLRYLRLIFGVTFLALGFPSPKQFCDFQYGCLVNCPFGFVFLFLAVNSFCPIYMDGIL